MQHKIYIILLAYILLQACSPTPALQLQGNFKDGQEKSIYLDKLSATGSVDVLANVQSDDAGRFTFDFDKAAEDGMYRIRVGDDQLFMRLGPADKNVKISGNIADIGGVSYTVEGSDNSNNLKDILAKIKNRDIANLDHFLTNNKDPFVNLYIANQLYDQNIAKVNVYKSIQNQFKSSYPEHSYNKDLGHIINTMNASIAKNKKKFSVDVGQLAPEIVGLDPNGKERKLSDLRGKVVLIDFWASWCGPCRKANPHVVEVYQKYKDKGFDVYSFSLDGPNPRVLARIANDKAKVKAEKAKSKKRWKDAIIKDKLTWKSHASELASWNSVASQKYGVRSIPATFLVDREGKIVAVNPRYNLEEVVKNAL